MTKSDRQLFNDVIQRQGDDFWNDDSDIPSGDTFTVSNRVGLVDDLLDMLDKEGLTLSITKN